MADLSGYIGANVSSGYYAWFTLSWALSAINSTITSMADTYTDVGWTQPTLTDGDFDGTLASGQIPAYLWPCHQSGTDGSGVPDTFGGALVGTFDGQIYVFYDPLALP